MTYAQAFTDERVSKITWIGVATMTFTQLTGINAIMFFSAQIFASTSISAFVANGIIGTVNCLATVFSMVVLNYVGKRPTIIVAQILCIVSMTAMFLFTNYGLSNWELGACIVFIIGFELGPGSICWPYIAEISP